MKPVIQTPDEHLDSCGTASADDWPRQMRIGWVAGPDTLGELSRTLRPQAVGLFGELVDLTALCPDGSNVLALPSPPVRIVRYRKPWYWRVSSSAFVALADELRDRKIELLHALDESVAELTARLAGLAGVPYVVSVYRPAGPRRLDRCLRGAAGVLAAGESIRAQLIARQACTARQTCVIRPAVHCVRYTRCFNEPRHSVSIVAGGELDDFAAFAAVLRTFAELSQRNYDCVFFLIGNGRAEEKLRLCAEKLGICGVVQFVDRQSPLRLTEILKSADVYLSPAPTDRVDVASLLAIAAGIPVFAAHGAIGDFLVDGETAMRFPPGDSDELTMKLVSLIDDRAAARALAESALAALREPYSPAAAVAELVAVYRRLTAATA